MPSLSLLVPVILTLHWCLQDGLHKLGYDKEGYDPFGYDKKGHNRCVSPHPLVQSGCWVSPTYVGLEVTAQCIL